MLAAMPIVEHRVCLEEMPLSGAEVPSTSTSPRPHQAAAPQSPSWLGLQRSDDGSLAEDRRDLGQPGVVDAKNGLLRRARSWRHSSSLAAAT